jgi:hypothetical protein
VWAIAWHAGDVEETFLVGVRPSGWGRGVGWPFGRLRVTADQLTVASLRGRWVRPQRFARQDITCTVGRQLGRRILRITCGDRRVTVDTPVRSRRILACLRSHGYEVVSP